MKIALNLSTAPTPRERFALAWAAPLAIAGLAALVLLSVSAARSFREYRKVHRSLLELQVTASGLRDRESALRRELERPEFREVLRGVEFVDALIEQKQFSLTELTAQVTRLLPPQVRLTGLALAEWAGDPVVRFTIEGNNEEAAEAFLGNLEDSPYFKDVAILNQGFAQEGSAAGPVTVACTAHYLGVRRDRGLRQR